MVSVLERFVCRFVMVTVAPGNAAPEVSVIVPRIVDVPNCPQTRVPDRRIINRTGKPTFIVDHFIDGSFSTQSSIKFEADIIADRRDNGVQTFTA